ncbi:hypothetical protein TVAG_476660 [Trichomonas vaginalis G3]|uniref:Uncharacterized protein n=1 Tax=Trichomonas vaginalis (strain ATCC PRA-98 / G3) TaxID=412133 RepID=A2DA89_TRIV3|nr:armadillo (ARM) repeat-containing protein family [Trichomonas vaginalis G3]EAY22737.1 hypothetical protein TVAG_476660 [Trichomonas vaginalis G3]KAI5525548.1 armadillo (ARM) repeat-containing protein family [Trichomonas vaginalis G3]|eukprot:XP_001583723.1 hypothetical protein [Trichomonas vaginalis G3]
MKNDLETSENIDKEAFCVGLTLDAVTKIENLQLDSLDDLINKILQNLKFVSDICKILETQIIEKTFNLLSNVENLQLKITCLELITHLNTISNDASQIYIDINPIPQLIQLLSLNILEIDVAIYKNITILMKYDDSRAYIYSSNIISYIISKVQSKILKSFDVSYEDLYLALGFISKYIKFDSEGETKNKEEFFTKLVVELQNSDNFYRISKHYFQIVYDLYKKLSVQILISIGFFDRVMDYLYDSNLQSSLQKIAQIISDVAFSNEDFLKDFSLNLDLERMQNIMCIYRDKEDYIVPLITMLSNLSFIPEFSNRLLESHFCDYLLDIYDSSFMKIKIETINLLWVLISKGSIDLVANFLTPKCLLILLDILKLETPEFVNFAKETVLPILSSLSNQGIISDEHKCEARELLEEVISDYSNDELIDIAETLMNTIFAE